LPGLNSQLAARGSQLAKWSQNAYLCKKNAMLYYPIGKQEFSVIRQHDFVYADKTP
jgi:hypothetical protein